MEERIIKLLLSHNVEDVLVGQQLFISLPFRKASTFIKKYSKNKSIKSYIHNSFIAYNIILDKSYIYNMGKYSVILGAIGVAMYWNRNAPYSPGTEIVDYVKEKKKGMGKV